VSFNIVFFCCCKLATLENAKSDYVTKNLKNVLKYIFQSQVDCCLPTSLLPLLLLLPANQLSPQKQKKGELTDIAATGEMKNKKTIVPVCCC
jgi:hypothetical protein